MREKCGNQGEENEVDKRNTNQESRDIKSTQNNADRNTEERLNQIEDEASSDNNNVNNNEDGVPLQTLNTTPIDETLSDNNNVRNNEDGVPLQTLSTTPIDIAAYPSSGKQVRNQPIWLFLPTLEETAQQRKIRIFYGHD